MKERVYVYSSIVTKFTCGYCVYSTTSLTKGIVKGNDLVLGLLTGVKTAILSIIDDTSLKNVVICANNKLLEGSEPSLEDFEKYGKLLNDISRLIVRMLEQSRGISFEQHIPQNIKTVLYKHIHKKTNIVFERSNIKMLKKEREFFKSYEKINTRQS